MRVGVLRGSKEERPKIVIVQALLTTYSYYVTCILILLHTISMLSISYMLPNSTACQFMTVLVYSMQSKDKLHTFIHLLFLAVVSLVYMYNDSRYTIL